MLFQISVYFQKLLVKYSFNYDNLQIFQQDNLSILFNIVIIMVLLFALSNFSAPEEIAKRNAYFNYGIKAGLTALSLKG